MKHFLESFDAKFLLNPRSYINKYGQQLYKAIYRNLHTLVFLFIDRA